MTTRVSSRIKAYRKNVLAKCVSKVCFSFFLEKSKYTTDALKSLFGLDSMEVTLHGKWSYWRNRQKVKRRWGVSAMWKFPKMLLLVFWRGKKNRLWDYKTTWSRFLLLKGSVTFSLNKVLQTGVKILICTCVTSYWLFSLRQHQHYKPFFHHYTFMFMTIIVITYSYTCNIYINAVWNQSGEWLDVWNAKPPHWFNRK